MSEGFVISVDEVVVVFLGIEVGGYGGVCFKYGF